MKSSDNYVVRYWNEDYMAYRECGSLEEAREFVGKLYPNTYTIFEQICLEVPVTEKESA